MGRVVESCGCGAQVVIEDTLLLTSARQLIEGFRSTHAACRAVGSCTCPGHWTTPGPFHALDCPMWQEHHGSPR